MGHWERILGVAGVVAGAAAACGGNIGDSDGMTSSGGTMASGGVAQGASGGASPSGGDANDGVVGASGETSSSGTGGAVIEQTGGFAGAGATPPYEGVTLVEPFPACEGAEFMCNGACVSSTTEEMNGCAVIADSMIVRDVLIVGNQAFIASTATIYEVTADAELEAIANQDGGNQGSVKLAFADERLFFLMQMGSTHSLYEVTDDPDDPELLGTFAAGGAFLGAGKYLFIQSSDDDSVVLYDVYASTQTTAFENVQSMAVDESMFYFTREGDDSLSVVSSAPLADLTADSEMGMGVGPIVLNFQNGLGFREGGRTLFLPKAFDDTFTSFTWAEGTSTAALDNDLGYVVSVAATGEEGLPHQELYADWLHADAPVLLGYWGAGLANVFFFEATTEFAFIQAGTRLFRLRMR